MINLFRKSRLTPIGLDLGARTIKLAQARVDDQNVTLVAAASVERPDPPVFTADDAARLRELIARKGFSGNRLVINAPAHALRIESLELPPGGAASPTVRKIAGAELGRIGKLKAGAFQHDLWDLPAPARGGSASHIMAIALPHAATDPLVDLLVDAGLDVLSVFPVPLAFNALAARAAGPADDTVHTLIDIGWTATRFVIGHAGTVLYHRTLDDVGVCALRKAIAGAAGPDLADDIIDHVLREIGMAIDTSGPRGRMSRPLQQAVESIVHELKLTHAYVGHRYQQLSIGAIFLTGGGAAIPGLADALAAMSGQAIHLLSPAALDPDAAATSPALCGALAGALYVEEAWV